MARPLRLEFPGALYHVTARGNERKSLFFSDADRELLRQKLAVSVVRYQVRLYAYTFMRNHFHLLVETPRGNLSSFMQHLNGSYTAFFNGRHQRHGHLFEGRFKARLVEGTAYLLRLTRYVHLNPVKVAALRGRTVEEKIQHLRVYPWGSYRAYAGLGKREEFVDYGPLGNLIGEGKNRQERRYRQFVESGIAQNDRELAEAMELSSKAIGAVEFCREVEEQHQARLRGIGNPAQVAMRQIEVGQDPERVLEAVACAFKVDKDALTSGRRRTPARCLAMWLLAELAGWKGPQIAKRMGIGDSSGVSQCIKSWRNQSETVRQLKVLEETVRSQITGK